MSALARAIPVDPRRVGFAAAGALLVLLAVFDGQAVLRGVFVAFLVLLAVPAGAMLLLLIHRLTDGGWGVAMQGALVRAAACLPAVSVPALPALVLPAFVFPWVADPSLIRHADVADWYMNGRGLALRGVLALLVWSGLAFVAARRPERLTRARAGIGLALFGLTVSFVAMDWILSLDPAFKSSAFAMSLSVAFLLAGLGYATAATPDLPAEARADAAKLIAAFALGLLYLDLMQFFVAYTGNLPDKAAWYARRNDPAGIAAIVLVFLLAAFAPVLAVLRERWRRSASVQRLVGLGAIAGVSLRTLWWTVPELGGPLLFWMAFGVAVLGFGVATMCRPGATLPASRRELAHGA